MACTAKVTTSTGLLALAVLLMASAAIAQPASKPPSPATAVPKPTGSPSADPAPDRTAASFGDWTLRCDRRQDVTPPQRFCELSLAIQKAGETNAQAQIAVGRVARGTPLHITAVLPPNIAFKTNPKISVEGQEAKSVELSWTRCIAGGCFADASISEDFLRILRSRTEPGRIDYRDGTERETNLPVSWRGFSQALDALAREEAN